MKVTELPYPKDPHAEIVRQVLDMPQQAVVVAYGDLYGIGPSSKTTDVLLRTGSDGFVPTPHLGARDRWEHGSTPLPADKVYHNQQAAEQWVRHHLNQGARIFIINPAEEA